MVSVKFPLIFAKFQMWTVEILRIYEDYITTTMFTLSNEDMILALAGQFKQLSHEPEKFR